MTNYTQIADMMQAQPIERKVITAEEFKNIMDKRQLSFVQNIDVVPEGKREVWGNRNFQVIVIRNKDNKFQIL